jgi:hypothetical protein
LIQQKSLEANQLGLGEMIDLVLQNTMMKKHGDPYISAVQASINYRVLDHLIALAAAKNTNPQVRAICHAKLMGLKSGWSGSSASIDQQEMVRTINTYFKDPVNFKTMAVPKIPDGSPIGMDCGL